MSSGSSNSSILNMPDYGQGLREALTAQTQALSGQLLDSGETLQEIVEQYERPLRMSTAQIDNDVLRQTLLGEQIPVYGSVGDNEALPRRVSQPGESRTTQIDYGGTAMNDGRVRLPDGEIPKAVTDFYQLLSLATKDADREPGKGIGQDFYDAYLIYLEEHTDWWKDQDSSEFAKDLGFDPKLDENGIGSVLERVALEHLFYGENAVEPYRKAVSDNFGRPEEIYKKNNDIQGADSAYEQYKKDGGNLSREEWGKSDFIIPKDDEGNFILEATSETEIPAGGFASPDGQLTGYTRAGTGLIDMLGDSRNAIDPATGLPSNRQAGFDENDNFLGLSALAEDIQRGNLSRQREADLADVERLSDRYSDVMDQFRPGTQQALSDASTVLEDQKTNLTGAGAQ